jgi:hypothetical protein
VGESSLDQGRWPDRGHPDGQGMTCITVERRLNRAIYLAKRNGGRITRFHGSHSWKAKRFIDDVGDTTVVAMVTSGLARYTGWHEGKPVEVTLTAKARQHLPVELAVSEEGQVQGQPQDQDGTH